MYNYMYYSLEISLGLKIELCPQIILANNTPVNSFLTSKFIKMKNNDYVYMPKFKVIRILFYPVIMCLE